MKKTTLGTGAVVVGLALLAISAVASPAAAQRPGYETYVVRKGDTLAKISGRVFGDEKRWPEILKDNPQVTNANVIFPGDTLLVPVPQTAATPGGPGAGPAAGAVVDAGSSSVRPDLVAAPAATSDQGAGNAGSGADAAAAGGSGTGAAAIDATAAPEPPVEPAQPSAVVNPALYHSAGYLADKLPAIAIVATPEGRALLGTNDAAIVNAPLSPGTRFTLVRANRRIFHPVTGANLGWLIRILGSAEVTCLGERTSTVVLRTANAAASVGDYLLPIDPNDEPGQIDLAGKVQPECVPGGARDGVIVAFNEERNAVGEQDLAYIDLGTAAGVTPGRRFTIYRDVAPEGRLAIGELQVLRAGEKTATALITTSFQEVLVGYKLRAR